MMLEQFLQRPWGQSKLGKPLAGYVDPAAKSWSGFPGARWYLTLLHKHPSQTLCAFLGQHRNQFTISFVQVVLKFL